LGPRLDIQYYLRISHDNDGIRLLVKAQPARRKLRPKGSR
jgi:hypothetical protein